MKKLFSLALAITMLFGCGMGRTVFRAAVVTAATAGVRLNELSHAAYSEHAATVRAAVVARHATIEEYDTLIKPADAELDRRTNAIGALSSALYAAAALQEALDAKELTVALVAQSARSILTAVSAAMHSLQDGLILPAVPIPAEVRQAVKVLEGLSSAFVAPK